MSSSKILRWSIIILEIFKIIYWVSFLCFLGIVGACFFDSCLWGHIDITSGFKAGVGIRNIHFSSENLPPNAIILSKVSFAMILWLIIRNVVFFLLGWLILQQINQILKSIKSIEVFYASNIRSFERIGKLCFMIASLAFFNFYKGEPDSFIDLTIPFLPILFGIASYVLAEVFKKGQELTEDKNSII